MEDPLSFGEWLKCRRKELGLTQAELAERVNCTLSTLRKIETGLRRPSKQLAGLLARSLGVPAKEQTTFIRVARGELNFERLGSTAPDRASTRGSRPGGLTRPVLENLPRSLTPFIGREPELAVLVQLLADPQCSLLTIVGPGGIGKTRLGIEAARLSQELFPDGIWFVPLGSLNSPALIVPAIAEAVDFKFQDPSNLQAQLLRYLRLKKALLVLDGAEHLLEGAAVFTDLLTECQQVNLLVTSRERLNLLSEWVFEVKGLPVPPSDQIEQFEAYSSVTLFLQSARRASAGFEIRENERRWVLKICQIMEGLPLGIELSAAWVGLLSCEEISKEIQRNLDFLSVSMHDFPERHRSLRATLDHSWKLLNMEERLILSRLAVFHGGFRREAAQEICGASLAILSSLRDKTLLYRTDPEYYALHEIIRQYAGQKLAEDSNENEQIKDLHAAYYVRCLSEWEVELKSSRQVEIFNGMALEIANLSRGWQHMVTDYRPGSGKRKQCPADLLHSALFSLSLFYEMRCRCWEAVQLFSESVEYLLSIQAKFENTEDYTSWISVLGQITAYLGLHQAYVLQYGQAVEHLEEAIRLFEKSQSWIEKAQAQMMLASIDYRKGQYQRSVVLYEQSLAVFREAGESWWYALTLINLARTYLPIGKIQEAEDLCREGFHLVEPGNHPLELSLRTVFAFARYLQNDFVQAEYLMHDNLQLGYQYRNQRMTANIYIDLSKVMLVTDRVERAEQYLQESIKLLSDFGESDDLAYALIHLGKCFIARLDFEAARQIFFQVIKIGQSLEMFYLVYWALVNIARMDWCEGYTENALELLLILRDCPVEYKEAQDEGDHLLADLQARFPERQLIDATKQVEEEISTQQARSKVLAYVQEHEIG